MTRTKVLRNRDLSSGSLGGRVAGPVGGDSGEGILLGGVERRHGRIYGVREEQGEPSANP